MTAVLSVRSATRSKPVRDKQFVRLRRKPFTDDLAKVVEVRCGETLTQKSKGGDERSLIACFVITSVLYLLVPVL